MKYVAKIFQQKKSYNLNNFYCFSGLNFFEFFYEESQSDLYSTAIVLSSSLYYKDVSSIVIIRRAVYLKIMKRAFLFTHRILHSKKFSEIKI